MTVVKSGAYAVLRSAYDDQQSGEPTRCPWGDRRESMELRGIASATEDELGQELEARAFFDLERIPILEGDREVGHEHAVRRLVVRVRLAQGQPAIDVTAVLSPAQLWGIETDVLLLAHRAEQAARAADQLEDALAREEIAARDGRLLEP